MTNAFEKRIIREGIVDTKKYRYIYKVGFDGAEIKRIEITKLGTIAAMNEWETVKKF